jgi:hypothetical protein
LANVIVATYEMYDDSMVEDNNSDLDTIKLVSAFTLDNCSVNKAVVGILSNPMIGAHCHHLNLAPTHWTKEAFDGMLQTTIDQIHACMKCASTLKNHARIQKYTVYVPIMKNKTRWMGNQTMAVQYDHTHEAMTQAGLFEEIDDCDMEEIDDGFSPVPKKVKPSLFRAQAKSDFDDSYLPALVELRRWISPTSNMLT